MAVNNTYVLLAKSTVGSAGASSITFSNIPQTGYTDLLIKTSSRTDGLGAGNALLLSLNGSTANFSNKLLYGASGSAYSASGTRGIVFADGTSETASTFENTEIYIPNYTSSNYKSISSDSVMEGNATSGIYMGLFAMIWQNTSAITSLSLTPQAGNFVQYSDFYLYGISNVNTTPTVAPKASGGDIIVNDGTYWYHAFLSSGTFTPQVGLTANYLVIAGGGGGGRCNDGGYAAGSGGGAGGYKYASSQSLSATGYTVTIGAGGNGGNNGTNGTAGSDSSISGTGITTLTATGGKQGAYSVGVYQGGAAGADNSYAGGSGNAQYSGGTETYNCGGGGGAGAVGGNATPASYIAGNGGAGINTYSSWATATSTGVSGYYAGGGGGAFGYNGANPGVGTAGTGGSGGGGNGGKQVNGTAGTANTGGGGGGGGYQLISGAGGSGIVIIRYTIA